MRIIVYNSILGSRLGSPYFGKLLSVCTGSSIGAAWVARTRGSI